MDLVTDGAALVLMGDFDVRSTWEVRQALQDHLASHPGDVVVDLTAVESVDLSALKVLAAASLNSVRDGRHVRLRGCGPAVRRLLHMSRLIRVVEMERIPA